MVKSFLKKLLRYKQNNRTKFLSTVITIMSIIVISPQMAVCLSPVEINRKAKQIAVRIKGDASNGSGVIISRQDNNYLVLTNWHVVEQSGNYKIQTSDGQSYSVIKKQQIIGADLALVYFSSSESYTVAERGNSQYLTEGQNVYFAGYPALVGSPTYRFYTGSLIGFLTPPNEDGYELIYSGEAISGMSGSPVFDNDGILIGVYGQTELEPRTGSPSLYGIPINTVEKLSRRMGIDLEKAATASVPSSEPPSTGETQPLSSSESPPSESQSLSSTRSSQLTAFVGIPRLIDSTTTQKYVSTPSTYYFTIQVPEDAGNSLKTIQFTQTSGSDFLGKGIHKTSGFEETRENRGSDLSLSLVENNEDNRTMIVSLDQPVPPGKTITIALRTRRNPSGSGVYQLRVTGFPEGENAREASLGLARFNIYSPR